MKNRLKADLYRISKVKKNLISWLICLSIGIFFSLLVKDTNSKEATTVIFMSLSLFLPLFFITPASIFWAEDFHNRTINTTIIKMKSRVKIYLYKMLMSIVMSILFVVVCYLSVCITRLIQGDSYVLESSFKMVMYQLPYYLYSISLCVFLFNFFESTIYANVTYIIFVLLFDNLFSYVAQSLINIDELKYFMLFTQLHEVTGEGTLFTPYAIIAIGFSIIFLMLGCYVFTNREFK